MKKRILFFDYFKSKLTRSRAAVKGFLLFFLLFTIHSINSQNCTQANIILASQADVDNFQANFGPCSTITGNVTIVANSIVNFDGLVGLTKIEGNVQVIGLFATTNMNGLADLATVDGTMVFQSCTFDNSESFPNLTDVGGGMEFTGIQFTSSNDFKNLTNVPSISFNLSTINGMDGFGSLTGTTIQFTTCFITSINGFGNANNLNTINFESSNIDGINGFGNLTDMVGGLAFTNCQIGDISGFGNLTNANGISFTGNDLTTNLDAFSSLTTLSGELSLQLNRNLTDINGLSNLTTIGGNLLVNDNGDLAECCGLFPVLMNGGVAVGGTIDMSGNLASGNCNNNGADVTMACPSPPDPAAVPTLGEWGLIILFLLVLNVGSIALVTAPQLQIAGNTNISLTDLKYLNIPFHKNLFFQTWLGITTILTIVLMVSVFGFGYEMTNADIPCGILASGVFAFWVQLFKK